MIPSWSEFRGELRELWQAITRKEQKPDKKRLENINHFFLVTGNILFVIVCLVFLTAGVLWTMTAIGSTSVVQGVVSNFQMHYKIIALFVLLFLVIVLLRLLVQLKRYTEMYKLLRIYVILEMVMLLHGFYKHTAVIRSNERQEEVFAARSYAPGTINNPVSYGSAAMAAINATAPGEPAYRPISRDSMQFVVNGRVVTTYIVTADMIDRIEKLERADKEIQQHFNEMREVEPVFITALEYIKQVLGL